MSDWTKKLTSPAPGPGCASASPTTSPSSTAEPDTYVALDVETANANVSTICQIGLARFRGGQVVDEWSQLVDPEDDFDPMNVFIHGIEAHHVAGAPTFSAIAGDLLEWCQGAIVVTHTGFDRTAIHRAFARYGMSAPTIQWLDSARVARRAWEQFARRGYGLQNVCRTLGYRYTAHDALEDAKACGFVLARAIEASGLTLAEWLLHVDRRLSRSTASGGGVNLTKLEGDPDGPLQGEVIVFTGQLRMPRVEAAELAAKMGADVTTGVSKKTTVLVVGDQDIQRLAGHTKSSKHRRAEDLIRAGAELRIVGESDFLALIDQSAG